MFRQYEMLAFTILLVFAHLAPRRFLRSLYPHLSVVSRGLIFVIQFYMLKKIFCLQAVMLFNSQLPLYEARFSVVFFGILVWLKYVFVHTFKACIRSYFLIWERIWVCVRFNFVSDENVFLPFSYFLVDPKAEYNQNKSCADIKVLVESKSKAKLENRRNQTILCV